MQDAHRDRLDLRGQRVLLSVSLQLSRDSEVDFVLRHLAGIVGPQSGHCLANGAHDVFHGLRLDGLTTGGKAAMSVALSKDL